MHTQTHIWDYSTWSSATSVNGLSDQFVRVLPPCHSAPDAMTDVRAVRLSVFYVKNRESRISRGLLYVLQEVMRDEESRVKV